MTTPLRISFDVACPAEHAFTRDEGPRFDPEATDQAFAEMIGLYRRIFQD